MKNKFIYILIILGLNACSKGFLDREPLDQYSENTVWRSLPLMQDFVNDIYSGIAQSVDRPMLGIHTDEFQFNPGSDDGQSSVNKSLITPSQFYTFTSWGSTNARTWAPIYKQIRACNLFLEQVAKNSYDNDDLKNELTGEVYFLRAYYYHELAFMYGGVPLIDRAYNLSDDFLAPRNTFSETIEFIVNDCDKAALLLPLTQPVRGRASKGAALALKSRVLLYAASDLYHNNLWTNGYTNYELVGYTSGSRESFWKLAKDAAKEVIDLNVYDLFKKDPAPGDDIADNYQQVFTSKWTEEDIFIKGYDATLTNNMQLYNLSSGYHGWVNTCPTQQTVDAFEMKDGSKFDWNNSVHAAKPYENREPRFYANIFYTGALWRPRPNDLVGMDPVGVFNSSYVQQTDGAWLAMIDARSSSASGWEGSYTGYCLRKFLDPTVNGPLETQQCSWRWIRYAEVLLNYAEACSELGEEDEAREYVNKIRKRAGLPDINTTGSSLREGIRHERKIELMGEDQRFFDIRRWMIAPDVMNQKLLGIDIRYYLNQALPTYKFVEVGENVWKDRFYFLPISLEEMNRNKELIQNPLY